MYYLRSTTFISAEVGSQVTLNVLFQIQRIEELWRDLARRHLLPVEAIRKKRNLQFLVMKQRMKIRNPLAVAIRPENQVSSQAVVRGQTQAPPHTLPTSKYSV